jgi:hypothetical protein
MNEQHSNHEHKLPEATAAPDTEGAASSGAAAAMALEHQAPSPCISVTKDSGDAAKPGTAGSGTVAGFENQPAAEECNPTADESTIRRFLLYTLSLPERALRSGAGVVGGAAREASSLLLPSAFRDSKTYQVMVQQTLDFLVEGVGGVRSPGRPSQIQDLDELVARKAVGNFVEAAGLMTLHISPLAVLAIVSDVAYGSTVYLRELAEELKKQNLIDDTSSIHHVDDLLEAVSKASATTAQAVSTPPLSVAGLKETIEQTKEALRGVDATKVVPREELRKLWNDMHEIARREQVGVLTVSSAMTMYALGKLGVVGKGAWTGAKVAGLLLDRHVLEHYSASIRAIRERGLYQTIAQTSAPYIEAAWNNFSTNRPTLTEEVATGRLMSRLWGKISSRFGTRDKETAEEAPGQVETTEPPCPPGQIL